MKKKKGFTLVELLAVIVILVIIALIAVPTILGVIEKARKNSLQDSGYGLVEAANLYYAQYQNGKTVRFDIEDNQIITEEENKLNYKGTVKNGTVLINQKGEVTVCINDGNHAAYKNYQDTKVTVVDKKTCTIPESSYIVYLDGEKTITELTNQELTNEIENLKAEIATLKSEKSNQIDVTNSINNLTNTHNSDVNNINNQFSNLNSTVNTNMMNIDNLKEIISGVGTSYESTDHTIKDMTSGYWVNLCSVTVPPGSYIGYTHVGISLSSSSTNTFIAFDVQTPWDHINDWKNVQWNGAYSTIPVVFTSSETSTVLVRGFQFSGSSQKSSICQIKLMKIK